MFLTLLLFIPEFAAQQFARVIGNLPQPLFQSLAPLAIEGRICFLLVVRGGCLRRFTLVGGLTVAFAGRVRLRLILLGRLLLLGS